MTYGVRDSVIESCETVNSLVDAQKFCSLTLELPHCSVLRPAEQRAVEQAETRNRCGVTRRHQFERPVGGVSGSIGHD